MKGALLATALVALPAALWWLGPAARDGETPPRAPATRPEAAAVSTADVEHLRRELASVRREVSRLDESQHADAPAAEETAPPDHATTHEAAPEVASPVEPAALREQWDTVVASQPRDRDWAAGAEESLRAAFAEGAFRGSSAERVDCRTTLCRLELTHADAEAAEAFPQLAMASPAFAWGGSVHRVTGDDGVERSVLYAVREGFTLPSVP